MNKLVIAGLIIFSVSCNSNTYIPGQIIKPRQMQNILWDMIRGDILARELVKKDSALNFEKENAIIIEKVLAIHNTDRKKFENSMNFYERHPVLIRALFDSLHAQQSRQSSPEAVRKREMVKEKKFRGSNFLQ